MHKISSYRFVCTILKFHSKHCWNAVSFCFLVIYSWITTMYKEHVYSPCLYFFTALPVSCCIQEAAIVFTPVPDPMLLWLYQNKIFYIMCCSVLTPPLGPCAFTWKRLNMLLNTEGTNTILFLLVGHLKRINKASTSIFFHVILNHCSNDCSLNE